MDIDTAIRQRLEASKADFEIPAGRYNTPALPGGVGDILTYLYGARQADDL